MGIIGVEILNSEMMGISVLKFCFLASFVASKPFKLSDVYLPPPESEESVTTTEASEQNIETTQAVLIVAPADSYLVGDNIENGEGTEVIEDEEQATTVSIVAPADNYLVEEEDTASVVDFKTGEQSEPVENVDQSETISGADDTENQEEITTTQEPVENDTPIVKELIEVEIEEETTTTIVLPEISPDIDSERQINVLSNTYLSPGDGDNVKNIDENINEDNADNVVGANTDEDESGE